MNLQPQDFDNKSDGLGEKVASYLADNPDFLAQYPLALEALNISHESGDAVSLVERQVKVLRQQNQQYREQLEHLIQIARDNDNIAARLHSLTLSLIKTNSTDEVLNVLQDTLRELLGADAVKIKLFDSQKLAKADQEFSLAMFQEFLENNRPSCGELVQEQVSYLFPQSMPDIHSVALVPVKSDRLVGVLALGSRDVQRFAANKSVDFLHRLGETVSAQLNVVSTRNS
jgi:uncharacterized protein YigA (DUF484 family)